MCYNYHHFEVAAILKHIFPWIGWSDNTSLKYIGTSTILKSYGQIP